MEFSFTCDWNPAQTSQRKTGHFLAHIAYGWGSNMSAAAGSRVHVVMCLSSAPALFSTALASSSGRSSPCGGIGDFLTFATLKGGTLSPKDQLWLPRHGVGILADGLDPCRWERPSSQTAKILGSLNCKTCHGLALLSFWDETIYLSFFNFYNFVIDSPGTVQISSS